MPITEIKSYSRPTTDVAFFAEPSTAGKTAEFIAYKEAATTSGDWVQTYTISEDGLQQIVTNIFQTIDALSAFESAASIQMAAVVRAYTVSTGAPDGPLSTVQSGIDAPFAQTVTYSFPAESNLVPEVANIMVATGSAQNRLTLHNATATLATATYVYTDSADYNMHKFSDSSFIQRFSSELIAAGCVRTIAYAMV